jgi:isochorismate synthase
MTMRDRVSTTATLLETVGREQATEPLEARLLPVLERAASRLASAPTVVASCTLPIAHRDPVAVFASARALGYDPTIWLRPAEGFGLLAIGEAWSIRPAGPDRFSAAAQAWRELTAQVELDDSANGAAGTGPTLIGGFPFSGRRVDRSPVWAGFEAARLQLPSLLVTWTPVATWLTVSAVMAGPDLQTAAAIAGRLARLWHDVDEHSVAATPPPPAMEELRVETPMSQAAWLATVVRFAGAVGRGRVDKVVLARQVDVGTETPIDVSAVIRRLEDSAPESTVFAVSSGSRTFVGATPERLARTDGREFWTVAMAGSTARANDPVEDQRLAAQLLRSDKEREEHRVVVETLRDSLAPLSERLDIEPAPAVVAFHHVQHLVTQISGRLRDQAGILSLVERLHPTPAVGGAPRELALELIDEQEQLDRGWYAGPIGWLDRAGDGEFVVAIRSGVVEDASASLFVGCGIVADSDAQSEWAESEVKLRVLASALGRLP